MAEKYDLMAERTDEVIKKILKVVKPKYLFVHV